MEILGLPEPALRLGAFVSTLALMGTLEALAPRRARTQPRGHRWATNLGMVALDTLCMRGLAAMGAPLLAVAVAVWAGRRGVGLLNHVEAPAALELVSALVAFDLVVWAQHWVFHRVPWLWRLHRVHHADRDIDTTTALRFHPAEIVVSMLIKVGAVLLLGPGAVAVALFEIVLNAGALFNHANLRLPDWLDRSLRLLIVTPDLHRVHHSVHPGEQLANFGFNLSIWDRLFGTYVAAPRDGHRGMTIGLAAFQTDAPASLWWSLRLPFARDGKRPP